MRKCVQTVYNFDTVNPLPLYITGLCLPLIIIVRFLLAGGRLRPLLQRHVSDQDRVGQAAVFSESCHWGANCAADPGLRGPGCYGHGGHFHFPGGSCRPRRGHAPGAGYRHGPHHGKGPPDGRSTSSPPFLPSILIAPEAQQHCAVNITDSLAESFTVKAARSEPRCKRGLETYCAERHLGSFCNMKCSFTPFIAKA